MKFSMNRRSVLDVLTVLVVVGLLYVIFLYKKEGFDNKLDVIPWNKICKKEYCDLPNYYNKIYPNKKGYSNNTVYSDNGKCCVLTEEMMNCLSSRGSQEQCKNLF